MKIIFSIFLILFFTTNLFSKDIKQDILKIYDLPVNEETIKIINLIKKAKSFDVAKFIKKYNIDLSKKDDPYFAWELAQEAAIDGRFGKADPALVFNLVIRGNMAPQTYVKAVKDTYKNWQKGIAKFDICDYQVTTYDINYCALRDTRNRLKKIKSKLVKIKKQLPIDSIKLLDIAYEKASKFIENTAMFEEGHTGTGRLEYILDSQVSQKKEYVLQIQKIIKGFKPQLKKPLKEYDKELNIAYKKIRDEMKKLKDKYIEISFEDIKHTQRSWLKYRDTSTKLFAKLNPKVKKEIWQAWLTKKRTKQLKNIPYTISELLNER